MVEIHDLFDSENHVITEQKGIFSVIEHQRDLAVSPMTAQTEYYMGKMGVRQKQLIARMDGSVGATVQTGAMQWMAGDVRPRTGIKGAGDLLGKIFKGAATGESAIKPEYEGFGYLMLEPTYKYLMLEDVNDWTGGLVLMDGIFLACESTVVQKIEARDNVSSVAFGNMGLFNLKLTGKGVAALESNVPRNQLVTVDLKDDVLKIDGNFAVCWSGSLKFKVQKVTKTLIGSAASGEGLVNVYEGTGRVMLSTIDNPESLLTAGLPQEKK